VVNETLEELCAREFCELAQLMKMNDTKSNTMHEMVTLKLDKLEQKLDEHLEKVVNAFEELARLLAAHNSNKRKAMETANAV
jgi:hypothetical protein